MGRRPRVTREQVLQAAREVFTERGFEATTLAAIGGKAGVSPAALLRHAATKHDLFHAAMGPGDEEVFGPLASLSSIPGTADPAKVLRRLAEDLIAYGERRMRRWMVLSLHGEDPGDLQITVSEEQADSRRRGFGLLVDYFTRASRAGRLDVRDPEAAAVLFAGSVQSYVILHHVLKVFDKPLPVDRYLDTLVRVWTRGAITKPKR